MIFPATTAVFAAVLTLVFVGLSGWIVAGRVSHQVLLGSGDETLTRRIRAHANFAEYVPLALVVIGLLEGSGANHALIEGLLIVLVVGRVLHPFGMFAPENSPQQFACRGGGILATFAVLSIASIALLVRVL